MKKNKICPICQKRSSYMFDKLKSKYLYRCEECGVVYQYPIPTNQELKRFYRNLYNKDNILISTENAFEKFSARQEDGRIKEILKYKKQGKLLDIGASSGFFLKRLKRYKKFKSEGIELSLPAVKKARENGVSVFHGDIFSKKFYNRKYDVITMHSVLEHISEPVRVISKSYEMLNENGLLVVSVPNIDSIEYKIYKMLGKKFPGFIDEHIYYFTPKSFKLILERCNFKIISISSRHHSTLTPPPKRPIIGLLTFFIKLFLEYTNLGGRLKKGNILYTYSIKND